MATWRRLTNARTGGEIWVNLDMVQTMQEEDDDRTRLWFADDHTGGMLVEESIENLLD